MWQEPKILGRIQITPQEKLSVDIKIVRSNKHKDFWKKKEKSPKQQGFDLI